MKKIILHNISVPLGSAMDSITENDKWLYLIPSSTLIYNLREKIIYNNPDSLKNIKITTFDQLMRMLTANDYKKILSQTEQELIIKKAIEEANKENVFTYFRSSVDKQGWIFKVGVWLGEIRRAGITSKELLMLWRNHSAKFKELANIYQAYQEILEENSIIDHEEPYFNFLADEKHFPKIFDYCGIVTEQFYDFSPIQMMVLNKLGERGIEVISHIAIDNNRKELFYLSSRTIKYLERLGFISQNYTCSYIKKDLTPLNQIKDSIFTLTSEKIDAKNSIDLIETSNIKQEIGEAAASIKSLIIDNKTRIDEIAIIVPSIKKYYDLIQNVMTKAGIPLRLTKKESLADNPYIQSLLSLLKAFNGQKKEWINVIFSPYFISDKTINQSRLMNIYRELAYPVTADIWEERFNRYKQKFELQNEELHPYGEIMKTFFTLMDSFPGRGTAKDFLQFINFIEKELQIKENIKTYLISNINSMSAFRDFKAFEKWQELKNELLSIEQLFQYQEKTTLLNWISTLKNVCEKCEYDFTQGKSEGIHILQPNQIMGREFSAVFILGLTEGDFPKPIKNDWLLPDKERKFLNQKGYILNYSLDYLFHQKYQFFQSILSANDKLSLVYSTVTEEGNDNLRSYYINECLNLLIKDTFTTRILKLSDIVPLEWERSIDQNQAINKIYNDIQKYGSDIEKVNEAIKRLRYYQIKAPDIINMINHGIVSELERKTKLNSAYDGILSDEDNLSEIANYINNKVWSTTQLNIANQCRFAYFAQDILKLTKWNEPEESLSPIEKGDIFHRILQRFFDKYRNNSNIINPDTEENYYEEIQRIVREEWESFQNQDNRIIDSVLSEIDWNRIIQQVKQIISHEMNWRKKSSSYFYPRYLELSFGLPICENINNKIVDPDSIEKQLELSLRKKSISLRGKIDRIDINSEGQFVIYDYKTGNIPDYKHIIEGINLQLQIYLFVLEYLLRFDKEKAIGAGFYTIKENRNRGIWRNSLINQIGLSSKVKTIEDKDWDEWMDNIKLRIEELITMIQSGDFAVLPNTECPNYCTFKQICRKDEKIIKEKIRIRKCSE